ILIIGDLAEGVASPGGALYDNAGLGTAACLREPGTPGVAWWSVMNGANVYEDQQQQQAPPPLTPIKTSPSSTPVTTGSSSGGAPASPATGQTGPLHIPAKRLGYAAECPPEPGVIRHSHAGAQPWNYSPADSHPPPAFDQYSQPTYYNLPDSRDSRKGGGGLFWSPASAAGTQDYKYSTGTGPGTSTEPTASSCHQTFSQSWCNYSPYAGSRHHVDSHHHPHHQYLSPAEDGRRVTAAMVAAESAAAFTHDSYALRNYAPPEPVPSAPYPPPGSNILFSLPGVYAPPGYKQTLTFLACSSVRPFFKH
ncbi:hypothetical protein AAG570_010692, partial [Ranatra chinensis]